MERSIIKQKAKSEFNSKSHGKYIKLAALMYVVDLFISITTHEKNPIIKFLITRFNINFLDYSRDYHLIGLLLIYIFAAPLLVGIQRAFYEKSVKGKDYNPFSVFSDKSYFTILKVSFAVITFAGIGLTLLYIPGIYIIARYSFIPYVWSDNPKLKTNEIMDKAWKMTKGHVLDIIIFRLSS